MEDRSGFRQRELLPILLMDKDENGQIGFHQVPFYARVSCDESIIQDTHENFSHQIENLISDYGKLGGKPNSFVQYLENKCK